MRQINKDSMDFPCCVICDNGMLSGERVEIVEGHRTGMGAAIALAHTMCVDNEEAEST